jgi:hypothetical protein
MVCWQQRITQKHKGGISRNLLTIFIRFALKMLSTLDPSSVNGDKSIITGVYVF